MAINELKKIAIDCISKGALKVCLVHRIGVVDIAETSVICIVSCSHRKLAFEICEFSLERIKEAVPIWKKEIYSDKNHSWKKNVN
jgi:molybdopterin synthase catalytic subunit